MLVVGLEVVVIVIYITPGPASDSEQYSRDVPKLRLVAAGVTKLGGLTHFPRP